ncbi:CPBP family intramembrane glutamic endopeptidase [Pseudonocardia saturnea]
MTTTPSTASPSAPTRLRALVARYPIASYLVVSFTVGWALLFPPALLDFQPIQLFVLPTAVIGMFGGAVLVTGLADGRAAVRDLLRRVFRWRVHPGWYLLAAVGIPVIALAGASAVYGADPLRLLVTEPGLWTTYLLGLAILPVINLWEEAGWMGFVQARLQDRHGATAAAAITAPLFGLIHLPLFVGLPGNELVVSTAIVIALAVPHRMVLGWLYNRSGASILIAGLFHAAFNAANSTDLLSRMVPGQTSLAVSAAVLVVWAVAVAALTRGRLGLPRPDPAATPAGVG